jgi:molybdopterin molybdotransferase
VPFPTPCPAVELSLAAARTAILDRVTPLDPEKVKIDDAFYRVSAQALCATRPKPSYAQSTRDGFALAADPYSLDGDKAVFQLVGEIAAGCLEVGVLQPGQAVRIMTGGMVPGACERVVPFEVCVEEGENVRLPRAELERPQSHIRRCGCDVQPGVALVPAGVRLLPDHLLVLAENGRQQFLVHRQPEVGVLCTGSELVDPGEKILPGQKVSGNGILLRSLLCSLGTRCTRALTITDRADDIRAAVRDLRTQGADMIITTGGMGPGRYDLMEQVFARLGGDVVYNRLQVRPGRSTLFGMLDNLPFFALPGPPPAVRLLFHELVAPALLRLQGLDEIPLLRQAVCATTMHLKKNSHLHLRGGHAFLDQTRLHVRPADRLEPVNAIIHLPPDTTAVHGGEVVQVRLIGPLPG